MSELNLGDLIEPLSGRRWSALESVREVRCRVARLESCGVKPGDRVLLPFGNRLEFFAELLAIWRIGACAVPVDSRLTAFEIGNLARVAKPRLAVVDETTRPEVSAIMTGINGITVETTETGSAETDVSRMSPEADALILFTSGSTGDPKGVVHTHGSLRARWTNLADHLPLHAFDRSLCVLPTHFGHGLICNCLFPWLRGKDLHITPPFRPDLIARLGAMIDEHQITFVSSVPSIWKLVLKLAKPPLGGSLRRIHCGSAPLSATAWEQIRAWSGCRQVSNTYGITETGSWVAGSADASMPAEDGLIGEGWGAEIKILKHGDTNQAPAPGDRCSPREPGYVWLKTPALMKGYFLRADLTAAVVRDGWFVTGDIGMMDERGRLFLRGRERDEINKGGMKIYPADIEAVVERFDRVSDVCAFAIEDPVYGEAAAIAVVLTDRQPDTMRKLLSWMKSHLADHKLPSRWWTMDEIPRTSRGKINRDIVREACQQQPSLDLASILAGESGK
ncbi:MAG TPA: class I adenylate-forming enzyme family protein [Chthoniobacterales bacterium]|nr:class I adenylate-forming enzyme family protein [Chthoniobacterales bacterium]